VNLAFLQRGLALQLLALAAPVILAQAYQTLSDLYHAQWLAQATARAAAARQTKDSFALFVLGATDAIDSGTVSTGAVAALRTARDSLAALQAAHPTRDYALDLAACDRLLAAMGATRRFAAIEPLRATVNRLTQHFANLADYHERELQDAVRASIASAHYQWYVVIAATLATLFVGAILVLARRRRADEAG